MDHDYDETTRVRHVFSPEEEARYIELARRPDIYDLFTKSIAPSIFGNEGRPSC